jgi:D-alanyl-lipoteichoic acid acyltransferase DltB (MBOAT superfamily)
VVELASAPGPRRFPTLCKFTSIIRLFRMATGLALMFGIRLPVNFRSPYKACSIIDFWRRWHITLSRLLRDYFYIPLGGNPAGTLRRYANYALLFWPLQ